MNDLSLEVQEPPPEIDVSKSQWYTPHALADRIVEWTGVWDDMRVLEPSCGNGAFVDALLANRCLVTAYDIDPNNVRFVRAHYPLAHVHEHDFLKLDAPSVKYDLAILNPPFEGGAAEAHVLQALKFARRVVAHVPLTTLEGKARWATFWPHVYLHRMAVHAGRIKYSGRSKAGQTAMCTLDLRARRLPLPCTWDCNVEIWQ